MSPEVRDKQHRLVIGSIGNDFDRERDLALGPWCFIGQESRVPDFEELEFPLAFETPDELYQAAVRVRQLACALSDGLGSQLNQRHGTDFSLRFWRYALMPWLIHLTQASWSYYRYIERFVALHSKEPITCAICRDAAPYTFDDCYDFIENGVRGSGLGLWMSSRILEHLAPPTWTLDRSLPLPPKGRATLAAALAALTVPQKGGRIKRLVRSVVPRMRVDYLAGAGAFQLALHLYLCIIPARQTSAADTEPQEFPKGFPQTYLGILDRLVDATMPDTFGVGFGSRIDASNQKRFVPGRLIVGSIPLYNDWHRLDAARGEEAGERIVSIQHGGSYGTCLVHPDVAEMEYARDSFLTWGWTGQESETGRFIPVPSPVLSHVRNAHRRRDERVIFVGSRITSFPWRLASTPQPAQWISYRKSKLSFLRTLAGPVIEQCFYRPFLRDEGNLEDGNYVRRHFPQLKILEEHLESAALRCRLIVMDYPGSMLNFALAANIPVVCFWAKSSWPMSRQARPFFEELERARILFGTPTEAAAHVNATWDSVDDWWAGADVQAARKSFCEQYARTSRIWWWHWIKALTHIQLNPNES